MPCDWPNKPSMLGLGPLRRDCARKTLAGIKRLPLPRQDNGSRSFLRGAAKLDQVRSVMTGSLAHSLGNRYLSGPSSDDVAKALRFTPRRPTSGAGSAGTP